MPSLSKRSLLTQRPSATRLKSEPRTAYCRIDTAPLASILAMLWFLFLASMPASSVYRETSVEQVKVHHAIPIPSALRDDAIHIGLSASGDVYINRMLSLPEYLVGKIRQDERSGAENRIYLTVDSRARYADVKTVLRQVAAAGVVNITFIARQRE